MKAVGLALAVLAGATANAASAATVTFELPMIGTWQDYTSTDIGATFAGTGYVGMYGEELYGDDAFAALFGLELSNYSRTNAQVNVSGLAGATLNSAVLSFELLDGDSGEQDVTLTGYAGDGTLGYQWDAPAVNYGAVVFAANDDSNAVDVTALLAASLAAGDGWFNMHLQGSSVYHWTYAGNDYDVDRAVVRLTVTYDEAQPAPEPAALGLLGLGLAGASLLRRRRAA